MLRIFCFLLLPLALSGCGISVWAHNEYITFSDVNAKTIKRQRFESKGLYFRKVFTERADEYDDAQKKFVSDSVNISFSEYNAGLAGLFPLIPPPPFIPVFFDNVDADCPVETDTMMTIRYTELDDEQKIGEYINFSDKNGVYLITEVGGIITPRHMWSDGYVYRVCFPLSKNEIDNTILNVRGLIGNDGHEINFAPKWLHYYDDYIFAMGYLGGAVFRCNVSTESSE